MANWWERLRVPIAILVIVGLGMVVAAKLQPGASVTGSPTPGKSASPSPPTPPAVILVHVAGAVRSPGVYALTPDKRVKDAIAAAGGPVEGAEPHRLNQAAILKDGEQIVVPRAGEAAPPPPATATPARAGPSGAAPSATAVIDLNRASAADLEALPGIGRVTADKIVKYREANGPFTSVDQLREQKLVGASTLDKIRGQIVVK